MSISTKRTWLKAASAAVVGVGLVVALAASPATAGPTALLADLIFWPLDDAQSLAAPETRLMCAIAGGLMVGWGVLLWLVAGCVLPRDPALARSLILTSVGTWFAVDSIGSVFAGAPLDALLNAGFLLLFALLVLSAPRAKPA